MKTFFSNKITQEDIIKVQETVKYVIDALTTEKKNHHLKIYNSMFFSQCALPD